MTLASIHSYVAVVTQTDFKGYRKTPVASNELKSWWQWLVRVTKKRSAFLSLGTFFTVGFDLVKQIIQH